MVWVRKGGSSIPQTLADSIKPINGMDPMVRVGLKLEYFSNITELPGECSEIIQIK